MKRSKSFLVYSLNYRSPSKLWAEWGFKCFVYLCNSALAILVSLLLFFWLHFVATAEHYYCTGIQHALQSCFTFFLGAQFCPPICYTCISGLQTRLSRRFLRGGQCGWWRTSGFNWCDKIIVLVLWLVRSLRCFQDLLLPSNCRQAFSCLSSSLCKT